MASKQTRRMRKSSCQFLMTQQLEYGMRQSINVEQYSKGMSKESGQLTTMEQRAPES